MNTSNYEVTNLADYYNASTTGDKTIYDIYKTANMPTMSNGFGIVKSKRGRWRNQRYIQL